MTESTIEPEEIYIDKIESGRARLLCHWNIEQVDKSTDFGIETIWQYDEAVIWWTFPYIDNGITLDTVENITAYITVNAGEILNYAKGTQVSITSNDIKSVSSAKAADTVIYTKDQNILTTKLVDI